MRRIIFVTVAAIALLAGSSALAQNEPNGMSIEYAAEHPDEFRFEVQTRAHNRLMLKYEAAQDAYEADPTGQTYTVAFIDYFREYDLYTARYGDSGDMSLEDARQICTFWAASAAFRRADIQTQKVRGMVQIMLVANPYYGFRALNDFVDVQNDRLADLSITQKCVVLGTN